jgi:hypothetical protein
MKYRVFYPLITQDTSLDFATREEAEAFAEKRRNCTSPFSTIHSWRHVRVEEVRETPE